jgi:hypothetical protein
VGCLDGFGICLNEPFTRQTRSGREGNLHVRASGRARARGMAPREQSCNDAQVFAAAGKSRADCPDRQVQRGRNLFIAHSFQSDEQDYRPLLLGQFGERTPISRSSRRAT